MMFRRAANATTVLLGLVCFSSLAYSQDDAEYELMMQEDAARRQIRQTLPPAPYVDPCADGAELPPFWDNDNNDDWIFEAIVEVYQEIQQLMVEVEDLKQQIENDDISLRRYEAALEAHERRWLENWLVPEWHYRRDRLYDSIALTIESLERNNRRMAVVGSLVEELFEEYNGLYEMLLSEDQMRADILWCEGLGQRWDK